MSRLKHRDGTVGFARLLLVLVLLALPSARVMGEVNHMASATITVKTDQSVGVINPCIYGHFTEHLGGVIYDGIWVGKDSKIPAEIKRMRAALHEQRGRGVVEA